MGRAREEEMGKPCKQNGRGYIQESEKLEEGEGSSGVGEQGRARSAERTERLEQVLAMLRETGGQRPALIC